MYARHIVHHFALDYMIDIAFTKAPNQFEILLVRWPQSAYDQGPLHHATGQDDRTLWQSIIPPSHWRECDGRTGH